MSVSSASTRFYRGGGGDTSSDYASRYSSFNTRSPSLDNGFSSSMRNRYGSSSTTSSTVRPLPVGPSGGSHHYHYEPASPPASVSSTSSSVRSIPIKYSSDSSYSSTITGGGTLGRRSGASTAASSKPPLPSSAFDRVSSSLGGSRLYSSSNSPDLRHPTLGINRYIRSSSTDRSSATPTIIFPSSRIGPIGALDDHHRRYPVSSNIEMFERLSDQMRPFSSTSYAPSRRPSTSGGHHDEYLYARSPSPLSGHQRNYANGSTTTGTTRQVPIHYHGHYDRERGGYEDDEGRDRLASLMTSPSASSGIGIIGSNNGNAAGSMSQTGLYRSRAGAISVPDVPTYAAARIRRDVDVASSANDYTSTSTNNGYNHGDSRRNSAGTNNSLERQELEDDDEEPTKEAAAEDPNAKLESELRRKYSPANYRRQSTENENNWNGSKYPTVSSTSETDNWSAGRQASETVGSHRSGVNKYATSSAANGVSNVFVKNEPNRSSTSSVDSSESRLSSGRNSENGAGRHGVESGRFIREDDNDPKKSGLTGLRNLGNTCFMNSVLQCLSNTRPLRDYCIQSSSSLVTDINNNTNSRMKGALVKAFRELLSELWSTSNKGGHVSPDRFKTQIQKFAPRFTGYSQHDAQEFLRFLLQGLHEDINRVQTRPAALPPIDDTLPDPQKAMESLKRYLRVDDSKVVDIFVGQLKSELKCTQCGDVSATFDPFWDLSLPLPQDSRRNQISLEDCIDAFTKEEVLDGDEKPTCEKCKARRRCTKKLSIQKFPSILVLHLKRFNTEQRLRRLSTLVDFPLSKLDLSPYAAQKADFIPAVMPIYDLFAVSNHSGTPMSGHYTAYCKNGQSGRWYLYDDMKVTPVSDRSVISSEAYVLFYELSSSGSSSRL